MFREDIKEEDDKNVKDDKEREYDYFSRKAVTLDINDPNQLCKNSRASSEFPNMKQ